MVGWGLEEAKMVDFEKEYKELTERWHPLIEKLKSIEDFNLSIKRLAGHFLEVASEFWVAKELQNLCHEVKIVHEKNKADLYIGDLGIEVKGSTRHNLDGDWWWGYSLGNDRQLFERDYRVLILVRADENSVPFDCFVITKREIERDRPYKNNGKYIINLQEELPNYPDEYQRTETEIEKKLHLNKSDFRNRWDKIKTVVK